MSELQLGRCPECKSIGETGTNLSGDWELIYTCTTGNCNIIYFGYPLKDKKAFKNRTVAAWNFCKSNPRDNAPDEIWHFGGPLKHKCNTCGHSLMEMRSTPFAICKETIQLVCPNLECVGFKTLISAEAHHITKNTKEQAKQHKMTDGYIATHPGKDIASDRALRQMGAGAFQPNVSGNLSHVTRGNLNQGHTIGDDHVVGTISDDSMPHAIKLDDVVNRNDTDIEILKDQVNQLLGDVDKLKNAPPSDVQQLINKIRRFDLNVNAI